MIFNHPSNKCLIRIWIYTLKSALKCFFNNHCGQNSNVPYKYLLTKHFIAFAKCTYKSLQNMFWSWCWGTIFCYAKTTPNHSFIGFKLTRMVEFCPCTIVCTRWNVCPFFFFNFILYIFSGGVTYTSQLDSCCYVLSKEKRIFLS